MLCPARLKTRDSGTSDLLDFIHLTLTIDSFIKLAAPDSEYYADGVDRFRTLCEGRKLIANIDYKEPNGTLHLRLIDPNNTAALTDSTESINTDLLREGVALIDRKDCKYLGGYPQVVKKLEQAVNEAKRNRSGMFEFGDIEGDDDVTKKF